MPFSDAELESLLARLESDRVERKQSLSDKDKVCEAICAFANDLAGGGEPGVLFIGAKDDGTPANLEITDKLLLELADLRSNGNILPFPVMTVEQSVLAGAPMAVVMVQPSIAPPVRYKGRSWIRVGPRRGIATREEEARLSERRRAGDRPFELRTCAFAEVSDLDEMLFLRTYVPSAIAPEILRENDRSVTQQLASQRFVTGLIEPMPTILGVLSVGIDPRRHLPGAYVQFLRLDGTDLNAPIRDQAEIDGPLPALLRGIDEKLRAHISIASDVTSGDRESHHPDYPLAALQQLVRNAVLHRTYEASNAPVRVSWYSDRIEILNPGGPFGIVTAQNFGQPGVTDYRNAHLAEVMKNLGYVQRFGMGILLARKQLEENGNPEPEFRVEPEFVHVTVRRRS
ncbi:putative DNA binding domain-containing protein [Candidatus Poribacteria bacterium]|nr:putative DNA binding domain-containing protein [Candidatus Poribacteria bacterium]